MTIIDVDERGECGGAVAVTQDDFCLQVAKRIERALLAMTGMPEGEGPAFAFVMWRDGSPVVSYATNRTPAAIVGSLEGVVGTIKADEEIKHAAHP